jgi:uncharacterized phage protein gp47/JayE
MCASAQGACADLLDVSVGSVTRALLEASASVALWLQYLVLQVLTMTRLATSVGSDVDSWVGDFGLARLPGTAAVGHVTLTCLAPQSQSGVVPVGCVVRTSDGSQSFQVIADAANIAWSTAVMAYVRPAGTASITVPVQAVTVGTGGNVQTGTINLLGQATAGIDTVTNALPLVSGLDPESDASLRGRFVGYINTRARATLAAVENTVVSVQQGLTATVLENVDASGAPRLGTFTVVADDGSGSPAQGLLTRIALAVDLVRPVGSIFSVVGPTLVTANISMTLSIVPGADTATIQQNVLSAVTALVDGLAVGVALPFTRVASVAYQADPNVVNVQNLEINGAMLDVGGEVTQVVRAGTVTIS